MEAEKNSPAGPQFGQDMEADAEKDPVILDARGRISEMGNAAPVAAHTGRA